jgi:hypothetical protein
MEAEKPKAHV